MPEHVMMVIIKTRKMLTVTKLRRILAEQGFTLGAAKSSSWIESGSGWKYFESEIARNKRRADVLFYHPKVNFEKEYWFQIQGPLAYVKQIHKVLINKTDSRTSSVEILHMPSKVTS